MAPIIDDIIMSLRACRLPGSVTRRAQRCGRNARALQRNAVAQRVVGRREVTLDVVRERIHAGGCRDRRRQAQREFGVGKHHPGKNLRAEDDALEVRVVLAHHRRAADFGAGARGGGQRDEVRQRVADGAHLRMVPDVLEDVAFVRGGHADHLGHVQRRAPAETDDAVGVVRLVGRRTVHHLAAGRVAEHAGKHGHVQPVEMGPEFGQHRQGAERAVGDDQRALETLLQQMRGDLLARAGAETDRGGE
jgi:hypothetical protein